MAMKIPLVDLKREYGSIKEEMDDAISEVVNSTKFILGPNTEAFENEFAKYCGAKYAVGVGSGNDALFLSLKTLGIPAGNETITVANTFTSTIDSIFHNGLVPVLSDIEEKTYNISVPMIENKINKKTKILLPVHLYGQPCDLDPIIKLAKNNNLAVVEDAAQAHGAEYKGKRIGSFGDLTCFSFYPSKNLGAYGDAGIVVTNNEDFVEKLKMLRNYGQEKKYYHSFIGFNTRLDEIQAAVLRVKLRYLDKWNKMRRKNAEMYNKLLKEIPQITTPYEAGYAKHVYYVYVIRVKEREELQKWLDSKGIGTVIHYPIPIHLLESYNFLGLGKRSFPTTEKCANEIVSLPMFPLMTEEEINYVVENIREFFKK
jgi:dTDP-4-amino-4,6-dideoxygalactose transaminase